MYFLTVLDLIICSYKIHVLQMFGDLPYVSCVISRYEDFIMITDYVLNFISLITILFFPIENSSVYSDCDSSFPVFSQILLSFPLIQTHAFFSLALESSLITETGLWLRECPTLEST